MVSEKHIQREIELALGAEPDLLLFKNSVGRARHVDANGKSFMVPYGLGSGSPDLVGILRTPSGLGVWVCFEVKRPGERLERHQAECHAMWAKFGARVFTVHSVSGAVEALAKARREVAWP